MTGSGQPAAYALQISEDEVDRYRFMAALAIQREAPLLERAGVVPGARVVDIGCGPAAFLVELARLVGADGEVVGVEPDAASRAIAERSVAEAGMPWARVIEGRGSDTGLDAGAWDVVMIRHVLYHVGTQAQDIVTHAATLVRPGGGVYTVDTVGSGMAVVPAPAEDTAQLQRYHDFQRSRGNDPDIGLRLHVLLAGAGLEITDHLGAFNIVAGSLVAKGGPLQAAQNAMLAAGAITEQEAQRFTEARVRVGADPLARFFAPQITAVGRRPA